MTTVIGLKMKPMQKPWITRVVVISEDGISGVQPVMLCRVRPRPISPKAISLRWST